MDLRNNLHVQNIAKILHTTGEFVEGNMICDINAHNYVIDRNIAKITNIQKLAKGRAKICEIGVNAGHSLLLMLLVNPTAVYTLFDLGNHKYTHPCIEYLQKEFPSAKIEIIYGNSVETVAKHDDSYDLVHIDGGHEPQIFEHDYTNVKRLAKDLIIFDDYDLPAIRSFLDAKIKAGEIKPLEESHTDKHLIYRYT
jgi:spermidine synthase